MFQAAGAPGRGDTSNRERKKKRQRRGKGQTALDLRRHGFNVGKRIGEANRSSGNGSGDVEEWNPQRRAAALVDAHPPGKGCDKFRTVGVVFHDLGIGLGIGQNFARGVDDGGAGPGGLGFLGGDVGEGMTSAVGLDAVGEEESFLAEVALDLVAQRGFPGTAEHEVKGDGGDHYDDQEDGQKFKENAVSHTLLIWGPRSGNRRRGRS